jgi:DNA-binding CsgD family transcriptional regulator
MVIIYQLLGDEKLSEVVEIIMTLAIGLAFVSCYLIWQRYRTSKKTFLVSFLIFFAINTFYLTITKIAAFLPGYDSLFSGVVYHLLAILPIASTMFFLKTISELKRFRKTSPLVWTSYAFLIAISAVFIVKFFIEDNEFIHSIFVYSFIFFQIFITALLLAPQQTISSSQRKAQVMLSIYYISVLVLYLAATILVDLMLINKLSLDFIYAASKIITCAAPVLFLDQFLRLWNGNNLAAAPASLLNKANLHKYSISKREQDVINLICQGKSNKEIAEDLFISVSTVKDHVHHIFKKTNAENRVQLTIIFRSPSPETH